MKKKKKSIVDSFLDNETPDNALVEETHDFVEEPAVDAAVLLKTEEPKAFSISKEVAESLACGNPIVLPNGIRIEPDFKPQARAVHAEPKIAEDKMVASAAKTVNDSLRSMGLNESAGTGSINLQAEQPPPAPPSDGKKIMEAFRRWGPIV